MANRSYMFCCSFLPGVDVPREGAAHITGISEWNYAIPLVARILVSAETRLCGSLIWEKAGEIALAGRYDAGLNRLEHFLARIDHPAVASLRDEALTFLKAQGSVNDYLVLECGEIFEMSKVPIAEQAAGLLQDMRLLDAEIEQQLALLNTRSKPSFWQRILPPAQKIVEQPLRDLGLGYWSNTLYYAPAALDDPAE